MTTVEGPSREGTYIASGLIDSKVSAGHHTEVYGSVMDVGTNNDEIIDIRTSQLHNTENFNWKHCMSIIASGPEQAQNL